MVQPRASYVRMMNYDHKDLLTQRTNFMSLGTVVIQIRPLWSAT
jgi:hypothetical protein